MEGESVELVPLIANLGFPIAVAAYVLVRLDQALRRIERVLTELRDAERARNEHG